MSAIPIEVRKATLADIDAFASFLRTAWDEAGPDAPGFAGATEEVIAELTQPELIRQRIEGVGRRMYVAVESGRVVGFAATRRIAVRAIELAGVVVLQSRTGSGIGTRLLDLVATETRDSGYERMRVLTETTNDRARAFYEANDFTLARATTEQAEGTTVGVWELWRVL